jgi:competence ComEA-like helix-hairpin-helix protein
MFNLTREEQRVSLFFIAVALIGVGLNFLVKVNSAARAIVRMYEDVAKVDLNRADKHLLMEVPGIGEKLSGRIIEYRREQGAFKDIGELKKIKGITGYRYEKIKDAFRATP